MDIPFTDAITTDDEFEATLQNLLAAAHANGVEIEGGWDCNGDADRRWDVVIMRITSGSDD